MPSCLEQMFGALITALLAMGKFLIDLTAWFGKLLVGLLAYVAANAPTWAGELFQHFTAMMTGLWTLLTQGNGGQGSGFIGQLWDWFTKLVNGLLNLVQRNWPDWSKALSGFFSQMITDLARLLVDALLFTILFSIWFVKLVAGFLLNVGQAIPGWAGQLKDHFVNFIGQTATNLGQDKGPQQNIFQWLMNVVTGALGDLVNWFTTQGLQSFINFGKSIATAIGNGIKQGVKDLGPMAALFGLSGSSPSSSPPATSGNAGLYKNPVIDHWDNGSPVYKEGAGGGVSQSADALISAADQITSGYEGLCEVYAETVIANATDTPYKAMGGTAREAYSNRIADGAVHGTGTPPPGSLVYFDYVNPINHEDEGHVGIMRADGTFRSALDDGIRDLSVSQYLNANPSAGYLGWVLPQYAKGTSSAPGGYALVGEEGPEIVKLPASSQVFPNSKISGMLNSGISDALSVAGLVASQICQAINSGLADINTTLRQAATQPVQITKIVNFTVDNQYIGGNADISAFAEQMRLMGV